MRFTAMDGLIVGIGTGALLESQPFLPDWFTVAIMGGMVVLSTVSKYN